MRTDDPVIKCAPKQNCLAYSTRSVACGITGDVGNGLPRKGSPVKKYMSSTAVKATCSPRTRKQFCAGLHISIRNWSKYSWARIRGHSNNFSNPLAAKDAHTIGRAWATSSRSSFQSRSRHRTSMIANSCLHTTQRPVLAWALIQNIKVS